MAARAGLWSIKRLIALSQALTTPQGSNRGCRCAWCTHRRQEPGTEAMELQAADRYAVRALFFEHEWS
jgi:hypothetical protein